MIERLLKFAVAACRDVDAPCQDVWDVVNDAGAFPTVFGNTTGVELSSDLKGGSSLAVGSKFRVHRRGRGGEVLHGDWTVTALDSGSSFPRAVTFWSPNVAKGMTATSTWRVEPIEGEDRERCRFTITLAIVPRRPCVVLGRFMCFCMYQKLASAMTEQDVEDVAAAACERTKTVTGAAIPVLSPPLLTAI